MYRTKTDLDTNSATPFQHINSADMLANNDLCCHGDEIMIESFRDKRKGP